MKSDRTSARTLSHPLINGTWPTTHFTRRSIAPTTIRGRPIAQAPDADAVGVDLGPGLGIGDGVAVVAHLRPGVGLLPRLAVAGAEASVVEDRAHANPAAVNASANESRYISLTAEKP